MKKLQRLIDRTVTAYNRAGRAQTALNHYCVEIYGATPSDLNVDAIIDSVQGGCGVSEGMFAKDFDSAMRKAGGERDERE